ncbi:pyruvate decarboxylase [Penicillium angulare]|uniref:Pyruvate decarboxylase n=1 Tax=Penicillium angulare TaxID=116970 RepID=A0A9W9EG93_9EURO|nr:pyruvate decarboxylase [Penicillium angulare]
MNNHSTSPESIELFEYLCSRVKEIGVHSIHGDFNLLALDYVERCGLKWVGNCNELNAGYAADGYARVNGMSVLMTVMGVGELSALNAVAGSFAEYVPVIHIVSQPSRQAQKRRSCVHHSFGEGEFESFQQISRSVSCMTVSIDCPQNAPSLIDEAIQQCWIESRPVTIFLPSDMIRIPIAKDRLTVGPRFGRMVPCEDMGEQKKVIDEIANEIRRSNTVIILVGGYGTIHGARWELRNLLREVKIPFLAAASGLGVVDTSLPNYEGLYVGTCSDKRVLELMQSTDLIISIGNIFSDLSNPGFEGNVDQSRLIQVERRRVIVKGDHFPKKYIKNILQALTSHLIDLQLPMTQYSSARTMSPEEGKLISNSKAAVERRAKFSARGCFGSSTKHIRTLWHMGLSIYRHTFGKKEPITHDWFWKALGQWLQEGDIILAETGTASFGIWNTAPPREGILIAQYLWSSIGYTMGACQGAALAAEETSSPRRRTILFIGDGSFQCGCQELSTIIRQGLKPIIFIICNNGYTVERLIHGEKQAYNDIQGWDHRLLPAVFGAKRGSYQTHRVETTEHLRDLFGSKGFTDCSVLQLVELVVGTHDAPSNLVKLAQSLQPRSGASLVLQDRC